MSQGWANHLKSEHIEAYSAGIDPQELNPLAVKVMAEAGVDISKHTSKHLDALKDICFDYVITVCDSANEACPIFSGNAKKIHVSFDDPPKLAQGAISEFEALVHYRRVRDEIKTFITTLPERLSSKGD